MLLLLVVVIVVVFSSSSIVACKKRFRMCDALSVSNSRPKEGPILDVWVLRFDKKSERGRRRSKMRNQSKECNEDRNRSSLLSSVAQTFDSPDTCCVTTTTTTMMMMMIRR